MFAGHFLMLIFLLIVQCITCDDILSVSNTLLLCDQDITCYYLGTRLVPDGKSIPLNSVVHSNFCQN